MGLSKQPHTEIRLPGRRGGGNAKAQRYQVEQLTRTATLFFLFPLLRCRETERFQATDARCWAPDNCERSHFGQPEYGRRRRRRLTWYYSDAEQQWTLFSSKCQCSAFKSACLIDKTLLLFVCVRFTMRPSCNSSHPTGLEIVNKNKRLTYSCAA